jgi:hypothetical protein
LCRWLLCWHRLLILILPLLVLLCHHLLLDHLLHLGEHRLGAEDRRASRW